MSFLKWLLKAGFILALMFLGLSAKPQQDDTTQKPETLTSMFS